MADGKVTRAFPPRDGVRGMRRLKTAFAGHRANLLGSDFVRQAESPAYWVSDHCYVMDSDIFARQLIPAAQELWHMCLDFVSDAVVSEKILASLGLPERVWDAIHASWQRMDPLAVARFDLAYDGIRPAKLHECNVDVVGHVYEAATFQVQWFRDQQHLWAGSAHQFAGLADDLGRHLVATSGGRHIEMLHIGHDPYDRLMLHAMEQALSARMQTYDFTSLASLSPLDSHYPGTGQRVPLYLKDFRWEHLVFDPSSASILNKFAPHMSSPLWSVVLESKGSLPWLWSRNPGHPNLLPAWLMPEYPLQGNSCVLKPLFSIRGQGVMLGNGGLPAAELSCRSGIRQQLHLLPRFDTDDSSCWASTGVFIVGDRPVALSMTESDGPIIAEGKDRTVPHILI
jgi:glutathionylspermidine synthase